MEHMDEKQYQEQVRENVVKKAMEQFIEDPTGSYRKPLPEEALLNKAESLLEHVYPGQGRQVAVKLLHLPEMEQLPEI